MKCVVIPLDGDDYVVSDVDGVSHAGKGDIFVCPCEVYYSPRISEEMFVVARGHYAPYVIIDELRRWREEERRDEDGRIVPFSVS